MSNSNVCAASEIQDALRKLVAACERVGGKGLDCPASKWKDFAMNDAHFDEIVATFRDRLAVHFPVGRPAVVATPSDWPSPATKAYYLEELRRMRPALDAAKLIFVVGRASPTGPKDLNYHLGEARMAFVRLLMREIYKGSEGGRDALEKKVHNFTLGDSKPLTADFFASRFEDKIVTWDDVSYLRLTHAVTNPRAITGVDKTWAVNVANQVAFVIAIPCEVGK